MPKNKNAAYRYRLIDAALSNKFRRWAFEELRLHISELLYKEMGIEGELSERQLVDDIRIMRATPPTGYGAPIIRKKGMIYYEYDFNIGQAPITEADLSRLRGALELLNQLTGLPHFDQLLPLVKKLNGGIDKKLLPEVLDNPAIIYDYNPKLKGLDYLKKIYKAIQNRYALELDYQAFDDQKESKIINVHPYFLKHFNHRWFFMVHHHEADKFTIMGVDRIHSLKRSKIPYRPNTDVEGSDYFKDVVGITRPEDRTIETIHLLFNAQRTPYIETKPIHKSQKVIRENADGSKVFELHLIPNFEFRAILLSHAEAVKVLQPDWLRNELIDLHQKAIELNEDDAD